MNGLMEIDRDALSKRVAAEVSKNFASLIPEGQFEKMVQGEFTDFFETPKPFMVVQTKVKQADGYGRATEVPVERLSANITPFQAMVWEEVQKIVKVHLTAYFFEGKVEVPAKDDKPAEPAVPAGGGARAIADFCVSLLNQASIKEGTVATVQELVIAASARSMYDIAWRAGWEVKASIAQAAMEAGVPNDFSRNIMADRTGQQQWYGVKNNRSNWFPILDQVGEFKPPL